MPRYVVERSFPDGLEIPQDESGLNLVATVVANNSQEHVTWVQSFVTADKTKTFCVYDGPSPEAIRAVAATNGLPVDAISQVSVLDPYFYMGQS